MNGDKVVRIAIVRYEIGDVGMIGDSLVWMTRGWYELDSLVWIAINWYEWRYFVINGDGVVLMEVGKYEWR